MVPEQEISQFVSSLREAAGKNLRSVVLYGSAASEDYDPKFSDINLLCILSDISWPVLEGLASVVKRWQKHGRTAPLFMTAEELKRSADVFAIEFLDIKARYRIVYGDDMLSSLHVPMHMHKAQLEYELREKLLLLRQQLLLSAGDQRQTWDLLQRSLPAFITLFRHALIAKGERAPNTKRESIRMSASCFGFDAGVFYELLDIREQKKSPQKSNLRDIATRYSSAVERVANAVDKMLDTPGSAGDGSPGDGSAGDASAS